MSTQQHDDLTPSAPNNQVYMTREVAPSVKEWFLTLIILMIPLVNLIMLFVWAFGSGPRWRANFCKANLLIMLISIAISLVVLLVFGSAILVNHM